MKNKLSDPGATVKVLPTTEEQRSKASAYLTRTGNADLLAVLGLDGDGRRGALAVDCPTCAKPAGSACRAAAGGGPMNRSHRARVLAAQVLDSEAEARAELLAEASRG